MSKKKMFGKNLSIPFLPTSREEMISLGFEQLDVLFISGDAYVDHPSFSSALLGRLMESRGYKVGIISQPDINNLDDFLVMGSPRLAVMISSGNIDSMVLRYTANNKRRSDDPYSPGGIGGRRPDRAVIPYVSKARQAFGSSLPVIIGGMEASLRKLAHYDFWNDKVRRSILIDSKADALIYGMGELQVLSMLRRLENGENINDITDIAGTAVIVKEKELQKYKECRDSVSYVTLPSYEQVSDRDKKSNEGTRKGKRAYAEAFFTVSQHENPFDNTVLLQKCGDKVVLVNPPMRPLNQKEFDEVQTLPYTRSWHPKYDEAGGVPALNEVQFSITSNRGCFGSCSFCAITSHQGRIISNRSVASLVEETESMCLHPDFKGIISDVGGPTANFQDIACEKQKTSGPCRSRLCLYPSPCSQLKDSHEAYLQRLRAISSVKGVRKVFIRSGIRYDYLLAKAEKETLRRFIRELVSHHVSGQLRIAPEHIAANALDAMGKPDVTVYEKFLDTFYKETHRIGKEQYCIPYFIAAHPGTTLEDAVELALYMKKHRFIPQQVQEFYPTPGTVSTCMYYTGLDPRPSGNFKEVYVPKGRERHLQRALLHFNRKENRKMVLEALRKTGRSDLAPLLLSGPSDRGLSRTGKRGTSSR
ncbi:MAG: YgiQ family radical SAM protein [Sphaerochaetaceae bacterium]